MRRCFYIVMIVLVAVVGAAYGISEQDVAVTIWHRAGSNNQWLVWSREPTIEKLESEIPVGSTIEHVRDLLGLPESEWKYEGGCIWTYGLHRRKYFQIAFDSEGRVSRTCRRNFLSRKELKVKREETQFSLASDLGRAWDIGVWLTTAGRDGADADLLHVGKMAFQHVVAGMSFVEVEKAFGAPAYKAKQGECELWVYRLGPSEFAVVVLSSKKEALGVQERIYDQQSGQLEKRGSVMLEKLPLDEKIADAAAWQATWKGYTMTDDRRGIGKRMETHLKVGMTRQDVHGLMGEPNEVLREGQSYYYNLHTDSSIGVKFDGQGRVSSVRHVGS